MGLELVESPVKKDFPGIEIDMNESCGRCGEKGRTPNGLCMKCTAKKLEKYPAPQFRYAENEQEYAPAAEAEEIGRELVRKHHHWLDDAEVKIVYVFVKNSSVKGGKEVLGRAKKIGGLNAWLTLPEEMRANVTKPEVFFLIELSWASWQYMNDNQKVALVDHELAHCGINENGKPMLNAHDCEEFFSVVSRHGQWSNDITLLVKAARDAEKNPLFSRTA